MNKSALIFGAVVATLGFSNAAHAGDCWSMLQKHFTWAQSDDGYVNRHLMFQLATVGNDSRYVSYTTGVMDVTSENPWLFNTSSGRTGSMDGRQYFSDRQYMECITSTSCYPVGPFNRDATDVLGVQMSWSGELTFTLKSWGGGTFSGVGECTNEMLISHIGGTVYVFSFKQTESAIVR